MAILLEVGEIVSTPPAGKRYLKLDNDGAITIVDPDGTETSVSGSGVAGITGDFVDNTDPENPVIDATGLVTTGMFDPTAVAPQASVASTAGTAAAPASAATFTAALNPATALLQGMMSPQDKSGQFRPHASTLTDANVSLAPGSLKIGKAILPEGTLTGNRTLKLLDTGVVTTLIFQVVVLDTSANTYTITDSADTPIATKGASPGQGIVFQFYHNGSLWVSNTQWWTE